MKKAYLSILLLISLGMLVALQIGLKGERYATEGLEYYYRGDYARAIQSFKAADNAASGSVPGYFFWLGRLHIAVEENDTALHWFDRYMESGDQEYRPQVKNHMEIITNQDKVFEKVNMRAMPSYFNSRNSDYGAVVDPAGKYLYFTSLRPASAAKENIWRAEIFQSGYSKPQLVSELSTDANEAMGSFAADGNGAFLFGNYQKGKIDGDIYYSRWDGKKWQKPEPLDWLNSPQIDTHPSIYDDSLIFFTSARDGGYGETDIWVSEKVDGVWQDPINLGSVINTPGKEQTPQLVRIDKVVEQDGRKVRYQETALYFASDTHPGFGGFDLFKAVHKGPTWQDWHLPQNLGLPINSIRDDRYFNLNPKTNEVYISSDRAATGFEKVLMAYVDFTIPGYYITEDEEGDRTYEPIPPVKEPSIDDAVIDDLIADDKPVIHDGDLIADADEPVTDDDLVADDGQPITDDDLTADADQPVTDDDVLVADDDTPLTGDDDLIADADQPVTDDGIDDAIAEEIPVEEEEEEEEEIVVPLPLWLTFGGKVTDEHGNPVDTDIIFTGLVDGRFYKDVTATDEFGNFQITLPYTDPWNVVINTAGYMLYQQAIPAPKDGEDTVAINFTIQSLVKEKVFVFNNIQFAFDSAILKEESLRILDDIVLTLHNNPEIEVEISGHTCDIGTKEYNQGLSERRAEAVVQYLVEKGVEADRLSYQGYGLTIPLNTNANLQERIINRRVEVKVVK
ncbi:MAG: OmpA family protein [Candidatus Cloacimonetes bacterium]|nr:OmpA family protein [Candidatus Cloacimonadota bacterium]